MRVAFAFVPLLTTAVLAACQLGAARPEEVRLDRDLLTVRMSTGGTCYGPAPSAGAETGWSGQLQDCPWAYAYTVEMQPDTNPLRLILEEAFGLVGVGDLLVPLATVTITDPDGATFIFETPDRVPLPDI